MKKNSIDIDLDTGNVSYEMSRKRQRLKEFIQKKLKRLKFQFSPGQKKLHNF